MIVLSIGVNVIVVDILDEVLVLVKKLGVDVVINVKNEKDVFVIIKCFLLGGVYVLIDVLGNFIICVNLVNSLRKCGKYV